VTKWFEDLQHDFTQRWREAMEGGRIPDPLFTAVTGCVGREFDLVHPLDHDDGQIAFLMVTSEYVAYVRFDPPNTTIISHLGSLAGGRYVETVDAWKSGAILTKGIFEHDRRGDDGPIRVTLEPLPDDPMARLSPGAERARERTEQLLNLLREWSTQPKPAETA